MNVFDKWRSNPTILLSNYRCTRAPHLRNILILFLSVTPENVRTDVSKLCTKINKATMKGSLAGPHMTSSRAWSAVQWLWWKQVKGKELHMATMLWWVGRGGSQPLELGGRGSLMPA